MSHLADTKYSTNGNFAKQKLSSLNKKKMLIGNELNAQNNKNKRERESHNFVAIEMLFALFFFLV